MTWTYGYWLRAPSFRVWSSKVLSLTLYTRRHGFTHPSAPSLSTSNSTYTKEARHATPLPTLAPTITTANHNTHLTRAHTLFTMNGGLFVLELVHSRRFYFSVTPSLV